MDPSRLHNQSENTLKKTQSWKSPDLRINFNFKTCNVIFTLVIYAGSFAIPPSFGSPPRNLTRREYRSWSNTSLPPATTVPISCSQSKYRPLRTFALPLARYTHVAPQRNRLVINLGNHSFLILTLSGYLAATSSGMAANVRAE
jgi:hypothetical protein